MRHFKTPMGWAAKEFAEKWFPVGSTVRIEYDSAARKTGYYGRVLGYVFARVNGKWVNYNVECVRAGMSPYFDKYGRSERIEAAFIAAEREARIHNRGIWSPYAMAYPNYDERLAYWSRRAKTISGFEKKHGAEANAVSVMDEDDWRRLPGLVGKEALLFSTVNGRNLKVDPPVLELHHKEFSRVAVTFSDRAVFEAVAGFLQDFEKDFVYFRGAVGRGAKLGGRTYHYRLRISDREQVFADVPGLEQRPGRPRTPAALPGDRIRWQDAAKHTGRKVTVVGKIVRTRNIGKITFLNFDPDYRRTLTLVIKEDHYRNFREPPEITYRDRTVLVRGTVTKHRSTPQIVVTGPGQIEIIE